MSYRDPAGVERAKPSDATTRTEPRRALWSAGIVTAIVVCMFVVFYAINARQSPQIVAHAPALTDTPHPSQAH